MKRLRDVSLMFFIFSILLGIVTISTQAASLNIIVSDEQTENKLNSVSITVKSAKGDSMKGLTYRC